MWTPLPVERVQVGGQRRHQRLALAGAHLGDLAVVQHHAADAAARRSGASRACASTASRTTANASGQQVVEPAPRRFVLGGTSERGKPLLELRRSWPRSASSDSAAIAGSSALIRVDGLGVLLEQAVVAAAEDLPEETLESSRGDGGEREKTLVYHATSAILPAWRAPARDAAPRQARRSACFAAAATLAPASRKRAGFCATPLWRTSKCRCGPVERPVEPTSAIFSPALHDLARLDEELRRVRVARHEVVAVVDLDHVAVGGLELRRSRPPPAAAA